MAIVIEDGSIVAGSNSYITIAELTSYVSDRGYTLTPTEPMLVRSFDFMAGLSWCVSHTEAYTVTDAIKNAQAEIAYRIGTGSDPSATPSAGGVKREKVDVLEVEYFSATTSVSDPDSFLKTMPAAYALLRPLLCNNTEYLLRA